MSPYINTETNDYPLYDGDLALLDVDLQNLPAHIKEVIVEIPDYDDATETIYEEKPQLLENGTYHAVVKVRPLTEEELNGKRKQKVVIKVIDGIAITEEEAQLLINR